MKILVTATKSLIITIQIQLAGISLMLVNVLYKLCFVILKVSLYYFIKSIELFYIFLLERNIVGIDTEIEYYLETASKFAKLCQNISFILLYKYFNEFFIKSIKKSK